MQNQAEANRDGVINQQNYIFKNFNTENFDALKRYESTEVDRRTWLHVPSGTHWPTSSDTHQEKTSKLNTPFKHRIDVLRYGPNAHFGY